MDTAIDARSTTSEHSVASSIALEIDSVKVKTECEAAIAARAMNINTHPNTTTTAITNNINNTVIAANNNNNNIINNNNNNNNSSSSISPHLSKFSPNFNNNIHAMNTTALLMHHQHQQQQQQHQQQQQAAQQQAAQHQAAQQQAAQQQLNGGVLGVARDSNSRSGEDGVRPLGRGSLTGRGSSCSPASSPTRHPSAVSPVTSLNHSMMQQIQQQQQQQQQQQHLQLSPPPHVGGVATANGLPAGLAPRMPHGLPPHSLGLLNSLQMMHHASPLELMAAAHHHVPPRSYNSPPPISTSDPSANECKLVEYRGQKVAAFIISNDTMLCLPQAFELFLKHLVGGLHTVYTKLKRLDIVPLVCNVEQVRILRGLGAIQPGVNRCKLLSCKDFDVLYRDCTTARCLSIKPPESNSLQFRSSRPGRPPKRGPVGLSLPPTHLTQHPQLKKHRLENGEYAYENGHISDMNRMEKSPLLANGYNPPPINHMAFMQMNHHPGAALMSPGMPPHGIHARPESQMLKAAAQSGMSAANMDALARSGIWENCRAAYEDIVKHLERLREERTDERQQIGCGGGGGGGSVSSEQKPRDLSSRNCSPSRQSPVLNLSKSGGNTDQGSNCDERSERSEMHSPAHSVRDGSLGDAGERGGSREPIGVDDDDDENLSDDNVSEVDDRMKDDEDLSDTERDNLSTSSQRHMHHHHHHHHSAATAGGERCTGTAGGSGSVGGVGIGVGVGGVNERDSGVSTHSGLQQSPLPTHHSAAAVAALQQHQRALNYSTLAAAAAVANGAAAAANAGSIGVGGGVGVGVGGTGSAVGNPVLVNGALSAGALTPNEALLAANDATAAAALAGSLGLSALAMDAHGMPSSTETLLRNIQSLLKVAADNARQQERQITYEKAELKMDVLREREVKDSLERQLVDERKLRVLYQKRYRRERKMRMRYEDQLDGGKSKLAASANAHTGGSCSSSGVSGGGSTEEGRNSVGGGSGSGSGSGSSVDSMQCKIIGVIDASRKMDQDIDCKSSEKSEKSLNVSGEVCPSLQQAQHQQHLQHQLQLQQQQQQQGQGQGQGQSQGLGQQQPQHQQQAQLRQRSESPSFKREPHSDHETQSMGRRSADRLERCDGSDRSEREQCDQRSSDRDDVAPINLPPTAQTETSLALSAAAAAAAAAATNGKAPWTYPGIDLMATGAFWQNYSESLAQEIEMERKSRAANAERDVKSPLADRPPAYYKNSVLFGSAN